MRIFSSSRTCSSGRGNAALRAGFTLVELLISIAVIGIVTSIVLVKYGAFDSTVLLKGLAYEIALSLREAQVRSVSVARDASAGDTNTNFDYPFGVTFSVDTAAARKKYTFFRYENSETDPTAQNYYPRYDTGLGAEDIRTFVIPRTMEIQDLCVTVGSNPPDCDITQLDVSFRRPKFKGLFDANGTDYDTLAESQSIDSATITVGSPTGMHKFEVVVTSLGQIMVRKAP